MICIAATPPTAGRTKFLNYRPLDPTSGNLLGTGSTLARRRLKSAIFKHSIAIAGHKTSVSLEDAFWKGLKEIAAGRDMRMPDLVKAIHSERQQGNLSSAIRVFVLDFYRDQIFEQEKRGRQERCWSTPLSPPGNQGDK